MSINNLSKAEIIDQLQMAEYQRDAMRENLERIQSLFNISITKEEMMTHNLYIESDEDYSNVLYSKLVDRIRDLQD
tara:strand:+ start:1243 stop:1470 length:228 start_codon:yes stop_codon:yes gene_type:complete